jgi:hypothetical protein
MEGHYQIVRHARRGGHVPVTLVDGQPATSTSWMSRRVIRREIYPGVGRGAITEVYAAAQIAIIDPESGRNTLWADLRQILAAVAGR